MEFLKKFVKTYLDADTSHECEVEIISGAGGGQMAQISSITYNAGTYTITLAEAMDGVASGYKSDIIIDNWKVLKNDKDESYISSSNTRGWEEFPIATPSKWTMFKVEFRGSETTLEELSIPSNNQHQ